MFQKLFFARLKFACFYLCLLITVYVYLQTSVAKEEYFAFNTPRKTPAFRTPIDFNNPSGFDEIEANHRVVEEDRGVVRLDESHPSHIGG